MIKFKSFRLIDEFAYISLKNRMIREIVEALEDEAWNISIADILITDIFRTRAEQIKIYNDPNTKTSVHEVWRGIDIIPSFVSPTEIKKVVKWINKNWSYDPKRPKLKVAIYHAVVGRRHIHVQVHPRSIRRH